MTPLPEDWELYDLSTDRAENSNLYGNPAYAAQQAALQAQLQAIEATLPCSSGAPPPCSS